MKIYCHIPDQDYARIEPYIECSESANPMEEEYWFDEPTERFLLMLGLLGIPYFTDDAFGDSEN